MVGEIHLKRDTDDYDLQIEGYTLRRCDNLHNVSLGGVCVYYKSNLPITMKPELSSMQECLVMELKVGNKRCFITCLDRSPSKNTKNDIDEFVINLEKTINNIEMKIHIFPLFWVISMQKTSIGGEILMIIKVFNLTK